MDAQPTLGYWGIHGRGAPIRYQLAHAGVKYEDKKYSDPAVWGADKADGLGMAFPNMPYFLDGACKVSETSAVHRYIAMKYCPETLGKTIEDQACVDMIYSKLNDVQQGIIGSCFSGE